jgi:hypothetical protein
VRRSTLPIASPAPPTWLDGGERSTSSTLVAILGWVPYFHTPSSRREVPSGSSLGQRIVRRTGDSRQSPQVSPRGRSRHRDEPALIDVTKLQLRDVAHCMPMSAFARVTSQDRPSCWCISNRSLRTSSERRRLMVCAAARFLVRSDVATSRWDVAICRNSRNMLQRDFDL